MADDRRHALLTRRGFLQGSALFATALGLAVVPAWAQPPAQEPSKKPEPEPKAPDDDKLFDADGVEYRVCPVCGYNMYKLGRMWYCEQCGYSYIE